MPIKKLYRKISLFLKTAQNKRQWYAAVLLIIVMSFISVYAGHFLFGSPGRKPEGGTHREQSAGTAQEASASGRMWAKNPVGYIHKSENINGLKQEIHILSVHPGIPGVRIEPALSHDLIYGFEKLSDICARKKAIAAVNGGFFSQYGLPAGMVVIRGDLISASTGKYPVFILQDGKASFEEFKSILEIKYVRNGTKADTDENSSPDGITGSFRADLLNLPAASGAVAVYTPVYGHSTRSNRKSISAIVENGVVSKIAFYNGEVEIPRNGRVISFFDIRKYRPDTLPLKTGDHVEIVHQPGIGSSADAYECGCWLVRGGKPAVPEKDAWVGVMTNHDPRTAIGIKRDGTVILLVVDGRQPGYSAGLTGRELAAYLVSLGASEAAMLDGGASAEMLVKGKLVNRPSYNGEERQLGGGILVFSGK